MAEDALHPLSKVKDKYQIWGDAENFSLDEITLAHVHVGTHMLPRGGDAWAGTLDLFTGDFFTLKTKQRPDVMIHG
jgi:hypothetical protein